MDAVLIVFVSNFRTLQSLLRHFLGEDLESLKTVIDLNLHARESGIIITDITIQEMCDINPGIVSLDIHDCEKVSDTGLWWVNARLVYSSPLLQLTYTHPTHPQQGNFSILHGLTRTTNGRLQFNYPGWVKMLISPLESGPHIGLQRLRQYQ